jgi:CII-binding regulator of phage lambda lysogenization HflD
MNAPAMNALALSALQQQAKNLEQSAAESKLQLAQVLQAVTAIKATLCAAPFANHIAELNSGTPVDTQHRQQRARIQMTKYQC